MSESQQVEAKTCLEPLISSLDTSAPLWLRGIAAIKKETGFGFAWLRFWGKIRPSNFFDLKRKNRT